MLDATIHLTARAWRRCEMPGGEFWHRKPGHLGSEATLGIASESEAYAIFERNNGFHATVVQGACYVLAGVDHVRSIPLFYCRAGNALFLSDDAEWVRQKANETEMDPVSRQEFQLTGYVTGPDTLFPSVKQLQAGEYLRAFEQDGSLKVTLDRYFRFTHNEPEHYDEPFLKRKLEAAALNAVRRLIDYAGGRQIVIPLSGGYDSRLIAILLKRLGYQNVATFTYGKPGNREAVRSRQVANALGLRWLFVEYSKELWDDAWKSPEREAYQRWASGWSSLAHLQDWLAVSILKSQNLVDTDCVFAPGHTGDFIAGGHIPHIAFTHRRLSVEQCAQEIVDHHYNLAPMTEMQLGRDHWATRITSHLPSRACDLPWQLADAYEMWEWQERQAKFICNSVRAYEFFGYDWWMPLWDREFVTFWGTVPLALRQGRGWYAKWVQECFEMESPERVVPAADLSPLWVKLFRSPWKVARRLPFVDDVIGTSLRKRVQRRTIPEILPILNEEKLNSFLSRSYQFNGIFAKEFLEMVSPSS